MRIKNTLSLFFFCSFSFVVQGQDRIGENLFTDSYALNPEKEAMVELSLDNLSFLKNNETDGSSSDTDGAITKGYTVPGFRLNPHIIYYPLSMVKLEAGVSLLKFWGANKYPNRAYRNIADWKADDYQIGFHFLPFFRVQVQPIPQLNLVMGNLYGGSNHRLIEPLYYPELNFTADPEMGAQILYDSKNVHWDLWINWESFTFRNDTHNEVFTAGISGCLHFPQSRSPFYLEVPIQALVTHRGGEIQEIHQGILTHINGFTGLRLGFNSATSSLRKIELNILGGGFTSQAGEKLALPFTRGWAFYSNIHAWVRNFQLKMGFWRSNDFVNILGNPIFGNESAEFPGRTFSRVMVFHSGIKYEYTIGKGVYFGADLDYYCNPRLIFYEYSDDIPVTTGRSGMCTFGMYLRVNPSIVLKSGK